MKTVAYRITVLALFFALATPSARAEMRMSFDLDRATHRAALIVEGEYLGGGRIKISRIFKGDSTLKEVASVKNPDTESQKGERAFPGNVIFGDWRNKQRPLKTKHLIAFLFADKEGYRMVSPYVLWIDKENKVLQYSVGGWNYQLQESYKYATAEALFKDLGPSLERAKRYDEVLQIPEGPRRMEAQITFFASLVKDESEVQRYGLRALFPMWYYYGALYEAFRDSPKEATPVLLKRLESAKRPYDRALCLRFLHASNLYAAPGLREIARKHIKSGTGLVRAEALRLLFHTGFDRDDVIRARAFLLDDDDAIVGSAALFANGDPGAAVNLIRAITRRSGRKENAQMRHESIEILGKTRSPKAALFLLQRRTPDGKELSHDECQALRRTTGLEWRPGNPQWKKWYKKAKPVFEMDFNLDKPADVTRFVKVYKEADAQTRIFLAGHALWPERTKTGSHFEKLLNSENPAEREVAGEVLAHMLMHQRLSPELGAKVFSALWRATLEWDESDDVIVQITPSVPYGGWGSEGKATTRLFMNAKQVYQGKDAHVRWKGSQRLHAHLPSNIVPALNELGFPLDAEVTVTATNWYHTQTYWTATVQTNALWAKFQPKDS